MSGTITVALLAPDGTIGSPEPTTCEGCGWWPLVPVRITDDQTEEQRRAWWEPLTVPGAAGEHTPERCRSEQAP